MLLWESTKAEFVWEGSWRDICIPDVGVEEWGSAVKALVRTGMDGRFTINGTEAAMPEDIAQVFARPTDTAVLWSVTVTGVQLNCHFFGASEIEFDLDPREITGQPQLDGVLGFMRTLAGASGRTALMTPENMHEVPFIRVAASGKSDYIPSDGFFEELARGRSG